LISSDVDRVGVEEILYRSDTVQPFPGSWSSDGRVLAFTQGGDIWTLTWPERHASKLTDSRFNESGPSISPDRRWLAYVSDESGQNEVYVQQFPGAGQRWMVSNGGGTEPVWARDSQSLYFRQAPSS
jgi:Tol biopolymer transport system component